MKPKHFKPSEIKGLEPETVTRLDDARGFSGVPYRLTSTTGGKHVKDSAHYKGLAVDIDHDGDIIRAMRIAYGLGRAGVIRVGFYDQHIHADTDSTLPQTQWVGKSK